MQPTPHDLQGTRTVFNKINEKLTSSDEPHEEEYPFSYIVEWLDNEENQNELRSSADKRLTALKKIIRLFLLSLSETDRDNFLMSNDGTDWKSRRIRFEQLSYTILPESVAYEDKASLLNKISTHIDYYPNNKIKDIIKDIEEEISERMDTTNIIQKEFQAILDGIIFKHLLLNLDSDQMNEIKNILSADYLSKKGFSESGSMILYSKPYTPEDAAIISNLSNIKNIHLYISRIMNEQGFLDIIKEAFKDSVLAQIPWKYSSELSTERTLAPKHRQLQKAIAGSIILTPATFSMYVQALIDYCETKKVNPKYINEIKMVYKICNTR